MQGILIKCTNMRAFFGTYCTSKIQEDDSIINDLDLKAFAAKVLNSNLAEMFPITLNIIKNAHGNGGYSVYSYGY